MNITEANATAKVLEALAGKPVDRTVLADAVDTLRTNAAKALQVSLTAVDPSSIAHEHGCPTAGDLVTIGNGKTQWRVGKDQTPGLIVLDPVEGYTAASVTRTEWRRLRPVNDAPA